MHKTTIYLPDDLRDAVRRTARDRGTSEAELIRTAIRHELLGVSPGRLARRERMLAALGSLDDSVFPPGYLSEVRAGWRA